MKTFVNNSLHNVPMQNIDYKWQSPRTFEKYNIHKVLKIGQCFRFYKNKIRLICPSIFFADIV